jgi:membrane associated rhomboid family serine protease
VRAVTTWVRNLIIANIVVFFLEQTAPGIASALVLVPSYVVIRPWTAITYMFLHASVSHIFFNMLGLYFFGPRVEERLGSRRFLWLYFISGIAGALLSTFLAPRAPVVGASAAVFGVMLAFARFWPDVRLLLFFFIPVEARIAVMLMVVMSLWSGMHGSQTGVADFAHLGGFLGGWLYLKWIERAQGVKRFRSKTVAPVGRDVLSNWKRVDVQRVHEVNRDEVNRILDKISAKGLASLTPQERLFLSNFVPPDDRVPPVT